MCLDTLSNEDVTEIEPSFEDNDDAEEEDLRNELESMQAVTDEVNIEDFNTKPIVTRSF